MKNENNETSRFLLFHTNLWFIALTQRVWFPRISGLTDKSTWHTESRGVIEEKA